jgi:hypothetical protein
LGTGPECGDDLQRSELLLPLRKPGGHHGNRRKIIIQFVRRPLFLCVRVTDRRIHRDRSLQFDPAPRTGEPLVSRRVPDYFLVFFPPSASVDLRLIVFDSKHLARRTRVLYIQHDPTTSCILNRPSPIYLSPENLLPCLS